ncbi:MAG: hypothetical protein U9N55_04930, partial [candidate division Zixibacteria bacterium]|nr:hypothetical protein [candidate division Zixibacteria bacterium]
IASRFHWDTNFIGIPDKHSTRHGALSARVAAGLASALPVADRCVIETGDMPRRTSCAPTGTSAQGRPLPVRLTGGRELEIATHNN